MEGKMVVFNSTRSTFLRNVIELALLQMKRGKIIDSLSITLSLTDLKEIHI
jgi:hypothetical protein